MMLLVLRYCVMVLLLVIILFLFLASSFYGVGDRLWWPIPFLYDVESVYVVGYIQPERNAEHFLHGDRLGISDSSH